MRLYVLLIVLSVSSSFILAQGKRTAIPSAKELEGMKSMMSKELQKLPPDQRKQIETLMKSMPENDKAVKGLPTDIDEAEFEGIRYPKLDKKRIASMSPTPSKAGLASYVASVHTAVMRTLSESERTQYVTLRRAMQNNDSSAVETGKAAVGLWLSGRPGLAIAVAGQACVADAQRAENVNNYAAMLTMMNGQHLSIPMLRCLEEQYPENPTILANIGQAWYGLGDMNNAERYLDSALRLYPAHSQAHLTKAYIEERRGNTKAAAEHISKSMDAGMSDEKEAELRRIGFTPDEDVEWPLQMAPDPVGLSRYPFPPFPRNAGESHVLEEVWAEYHKDIDDMIQTVVEKASRYEAEMQADAQRIMNGDFSGIRRTAGESAGPLSKRARLKLRQLQKDKSGENTVAQRQFVRASEEKEYKLAQYESIRTTENEDVQRRIEAGTLKCLEGEGSSDRDMECCPAWYAIESKWLATSNQAIIQHAEQQLNLYRRTVNQQLNLVPYGYDQRYTDHFNLVVLKNYLGMLRSTIPKFSNPPCGIKDTVKKGPSTIKKLLDYDETHCQYHTRFNSNFLGLELGIFSINIDCHLMTTSLNLGSIRGTITEDLRFADGFIPNKITSGSVDIDLSIGKANLGSWGPVKVGASAGVDVHVEFTSEGIQEIKATGTAKVDVGASLLEKSVGFVDAVKSNGQIKDGEMIRLPGVSDSKATIGKVTGTLTMNSGSGLTESHSLKGIKLW